MVHAQGMIITPEMTCLELKQLKTKSSTDVAKVVLANHTGLQASGVIEEGSGVSSGSHDLLHRGGVKADSAELLVDVHTVEKPQGSLCFL